MMMRAPLDAAACCADRILAWEALPDDRRAANPMAQVLPCEAHGAGVGDPCFRAKNLDDWIMAAQGADYQVGRARADRLRIAAREHTEDELLATKRALNEAKDRARLAWARADLAAGVDWPRPEVPRHQDAAQAWKECAEGLAREEALRRELAAVRTPLDGVWLWMGDGSDRPESLSCPVVMLPEKLRELLDELKENRAELALVAHVYRDIRHACGITIEPIVDGVCRVVGERNTLRAQVEEARTAAYNLRDAPSVAWTPKEVTAFGEVLTRLDPLGEHDPERAPLSETRTT